MCMWLCVNHRIKFNVNLLIIIIISITKTYNYLISSYDLSLRLNGFISLTVLTAIHFHTITFIPSFWETFFGGLVYREKQLIKELFSIQGSLNHSCTEGPLPFETTTPNLQGPFLSVSVRLNDVIS